MSSSKPSNVPTRRKRTISERVTDNGDPLVVRKKAREAEKSKKTTQVNVFKKIKINMNSLIISQKATVEDVEEENNHPQNAIPKKGSRILEPADGSEDDDDDEPIVLDGDGDTELNESGDESPEETAEAELGK